MATNGRQNGYLSHRSSTGDLGSSSVVRATEGWLELFLTPPEKHNFSQWQEIVRDHSVVHNHSRPLFRYLAQFLPNNLAPNVVTLTGFLSLFQAWYLTNKYGESYPTACTMLACTNILLFFITNEITSYHAERIRQQSALNDLFKYCCDSGSTVWLTMLTVYLLGGNEIQTQWYAVQAAQLILLLKHLSAFRRHAGLRFLAVAGPGEVIMTCLALLGLRGIVGIDGLSNIYQFIVRYVSPFEYEPTFDEAIHMLYYGLFIASILQSLRLGKQHGWTCFGLVVSLFMRVIPALLMQAGVAFSLSLVDVICDGFFLAVLTSDLILAKMSDRELHPWVVLMSLTAVLSHTIILILVAVYYIGVFSDLCFYLNLPLLATCRNVYCDGVYDLCHIGHKRAFQNALALGNRLLVGVMSDEDCANYKRPPIMTHAERCAEVEACKSVTKVIPNAPCFGLTQQFLDEHNIHVVAMGEEYLTKYPDPKDDPYYGLPRKLGIAVPLPRTNELSTTDLIKRIQKATLDKNSPT